MTMASAMTGRHCILCSQQRSIALCHCYQLHSFLWFDNSRICACYGAFCTHHEDVVSRGRFAFRRLFHCQRRHAFHHFPCLQHGKHRKRLFRNSRHLWRHVALWLVYQARPQHRRSFPLHDAHRVDYCHDCQYLPCQQRFRPRDPPLSV